MNGGLLHITELKFAVGDKVICTDASMTPMSWPDLELNKIYTVRQIKLNEGKTGVTGVNLVEIPDVFHDDTDKDGCAYAGWRFELHKKGGVKINLV